MKQRKAWLVGLLGICTLFVYSAIWWYKFQSDLKNETNRGYMPIGHLMIMLMPVVNIIYYFVWICQVDGKLVFLGAPKGNRAWLYVILSLIGLGFIVVFPMIQSKANNIGLIEIRNKTKEEVRTDKYAKYFNNDKK